MRLLRPVTRLLSPTPRVILVDDGESSTYIHGNAFTNNGGDVFRITDGSAFLRGNHLDVASGRTGVYVYRLEAGDVVQTGKLILVK